MREHLEKKYVFLTPGRKELHYMFQILEKCYEHGLQVAINLPIANDFSHNKSLTQSLRAVCCKDQLRSCNIEKTDFPKLCQNKGLGELVLKI